MRKIVFVVGVFVVLILGVYLGYNRGFSVGVSVGAQEKGMECLTAMYATAKMPLYQSKLLYEAVDSQSGDLDTGLKSASREAMKLNLELFKNSYNNLSPEQREKFEVEHYKTISEFEALK